MGNVTQVTANVPGRLAVALHDVEPATFERCALIRDWLVDQDVDRLTLFVVPARDLHPFDRRSPGLAEWLAERRLAGDAIAQQGFCRPGEFVGLDRPQTRQVVDAGRRLLRLAGVEPSGFGAPAYVYTPALHEALSRSFAWWAALREIHRRAVVEPLGATAVSLTRLVSPWRPRWRGTLASELVRLDIHPSELDSGRHVAALERLLEASRHRARVTYDEL